MNDEQKIEKLIEHAPDMLAEYEKFWTPEFMGTLNAQVAERITGLMDERLGVLLCTTFLEIFAPEDIYEDVSKETISALTLRKGSTPREISDINGLKTNFDNLAKLFAEYFTRVYVEQGCADDILEEVAGECE